MTDYTRDAPSEREAIGWTKLCLSQGQKALILLPMGDVRRQTRYLARSATVNGLLTDRELQIVRLLASGMMNDGIGDELRLSSRTVKTHLARISERIGAKGREHIVAICLRAKWID